MNSIMEIRSIVVPLIEAAGNLILEELKDVQYTAKSPYDILAKADLEVENFLLSSLYEAFPTHSILSEEKGDDGKTGEYKWILDPVDGTINFSQGLPDFCISMALMQQDKVVFGIIYQPLLKDLYLAELGKGSSLNGQPIQMKKKAHLIELVGATESASKPDFRLRNLQTLTALSGKIKSFRVSGSAALNLARVAAGKLDFYFNHRLNLWDVAAGNILITEAGGVMTDFAGQAITPASKNSIAAHPDVYAELRAAILESTNGVSFA